MLGELILYGLVHGGQSISCCGLLRTYCRDGVTQFGVDAVYFCLVVQGNQLGLGYSHFLLKCDERGMTCFGVLRTQGFIYSRGISINPLLILLDGTCVKLRSSRYEVNLDGVQHVHKCKVLIIVYIFVGSSNLAFSVCAGGQQAILGFTEEFCIIGFDKNIVELLLNVIDIIAAIHEIAISISFQGIQLVLCSGQRIHDFGVCSETIGIRLCGSHGCCVAVFSREATDTRYHVLICAVHGAGFYRSVTECLCTVYNPGFPSIIVIAKESIRFLYLGIYEYAVQRIHLGVMQRLQTIHGGGVPAL